MTSIYLRFAAAPFLLGLGALIFAIRHHIEWSEAVKLFGLGCQLTGMLLVFRSINARRHQYSSETLYEMIQGWIKRTTARLLGRKTVVTASFSAAGITVVGGHANLSTAVNTEAAIALKVDWLLRQIGVLGDQLYNHDKRIDAAEKELQKRHQELRAELNAKVKGLNEAIREIAVGGIHVDEIGAIALTIGIVLATIPDEVVHLFRSLH